MSETKTIPDGVDARTAIIAIAYEMSAITVNSLPTSTPLVRLKNKVKLFNAVNKALSENTDLPEIALES